MKSLIPANDLEHIDSKDIRELPRPAQYAVINRQLIPVASMPEEMWEAVAEFLHENHGIRKGWTRERLRVHKNVMIQAEKDDLLKQFNKSEGPFYRVVEGFWMRYTGGVLVSICDDEIEPALYMFLSRQPLFHLAGHSIKKLTAQLLKELPNVPGCMLPRRVKFDIQPHFLNMENGMLDIMTRRLLHHNISYMSSIRIPYEYNASAGCPTWERFIVDILPDDPGARDFIQMFFGFCLIPIYNYQIFLILYGEGGNGKSVLLHALTHLVGEANTSFLNLSDLSQQFQRMMLKGKLVNISAENDDSIKYKTSALKTLTSGDEAITAAYKFKTPVSFVSHAKFIFSTNRNLHFDDKSLGFRQRMHVIRFNEVFRGTDREIGTLNEILSEERAGILNWAIDGYHMLRHQGRFLETPSMKRAAEEMFHWQSSVHAFVKGKCEIDARFSIGSHTLYDAYTKYCQTIKLKPKSFTEFYPELERLVPSIVITEQIEGRLNNHTPNRIVEGIDLWSMYPRY